MLIPKISGDLFLTKKKQQLQQQPPKIVGNLVEKFRILTDERNRYPQTFSLSRGLEIFNCSSELLFYRKNSLSAAGEFRRCRLK